MIRQLSWTVVLLVVWAQTAQAAEVVWEVVSLGSSAAGAFSEQFDGRCRYDCHRYAGVSDH